MGDLPGIAQLQPLVRLLHLVAIDDSLVEDAEVIPQAIPDGGQIQRCHGVQKTGSQSAQASVSQTGIHFMVPQLIPIQSQFEIEPPGTPPPSAD